MTAPYRYVRECAPVALATVAGLSPRGAANRLWSVRTFWGGKGPEVGAGVASYGTPLHAVGDSLVRFGWSCELWSGERGGSLVADRTMYPELLSRLAHERVRRHRRDHGGAHGHHDQGGQEGGPDPGRAPSTLRTLADWTARMRAGFWLYVLTPATKPAHLVLYWGTMQLAGNEDGSYNEAPVVRALRALRPDQPEKRRGR